MDSAESARADKIVRDLLATVFDRLGQGDANAFTPAGMTVAELVTLYGLARIPTDALEIGMANATSSVVICAALAACGGGRLVSIDPFQAQEYQNQGLANIERAGFAARHELIEEANYIALPRLAAEQRRFGLVLIDGWHSFDHAMLDMFYADLLLEDGGALVFHDTDLPSVYKAVRFLETHKPYERLSPSPAVILTRTWPRIRRRLTAALRGADARSDAQMRRTQWRTLSAYRKIRSETTPEALAVPF
jgi:hypothetical protein